MSETWDFIVKDIPAMTGVDGITIRRTPTGDVDYYGARPWEAAHGRSYLGHGETPTDAVMDLWETIRERLKLQSRERGPLATEPLRTTLDGEG